MVEFNNKSWKVKVILLVLPFAWKYKTFFNLKKIKIYPFVLEFYYFDQK